MTMIVMLLVLVMIMMMMLITTVMMMVMMMIQSPLPPPPQQLILLPLLLLLLLLLLLPLLLQHTPDARPGSMNNDYGSTFVGKTTKVESYTATGISNTILASRLSYVFNLHGPCMVLDTACSASLIAVHLGCQAIRSGQSD